MLIAILALYAAHSNESEWQTFRNNKNNEAFLDRVYIDQGVMEFVEMFKRRSKCYIRY